MPHEIYEQLAVFEYMGPEQISYFRNRLEEMRNEAMQRMSERVDKRERMADEADQASMDESYWMTVQLRDRDYRKLKEVESALRLVRSGDYGYCEETGDEIGLKRLIANPAAIFSAEAMQRRERMEKIHAA